MSEQAHFEITNLVTPEGDEAIGTVEIVPGVALLDTSDDGRSAYYLDETKLGWNGQYTLKGPNGGVLLISREGKIWEAEHTTPQRLPTFDECPQRLVRQMAKAIACLLRDFSDYEGPVIDNARASLVDAEEVLGERIEADPQVAFNPPDETS